MTNLIVFGIIVLIIGISLSKVIREKKRGNKCVGCPLSGTAKGSGCSCS
ncbi:FeoB-associated Cys-rich membrane protein [Thiospirochaeta perfilievii]|uniref:FeoB-associated Cys-rich membrane protein n=1 Tax=Thiospirochaeta perfilievii TaxID=252967 RepID=A0A5C1QDM5_9SPIO|nr:FeoB-associated Cys-rich membrane protein [Thiospirochaeta perfilievii]QEN04302.1 FeoB-associated Cys-rich membrane protein [Thiospirochaeta perfilievii]